MKVRVRARVRLRVTVRYSAAYTSLIDVARRHHAPSLADRFEELERPLARRAYRGERTVFAHRAARASRWLALLRSCSILAALVAPTSEDSA